jgi:DNA-binding CsgD family transcriptional regulator
MNTEQLSHFLLNLYDAVPALGVEQFTRHVFGHLQTLLRFDSGGYVQFSAAENQQLRMTSASAFNIDAERKLRLRMELLGCEKMHDLRELISSDPLIQAGFHRPQTAVHGNVADFGERHLQEYAKATEALNTLTMVLPSSNGYPLQTLSLWRNKSAARYTSTQSRLANAVLPHIFRAFLTNRELHVGKLYGSQHHSLISGLNGQIMYVDPALSALMFQHYPDWRPPFLPERLHRLLLADFSGMVQDGSLQVRWRQEHGLLFLSLTEIRIQLPLSPAESRVAQLLSEGLSYKEIARTLGNQPATVRNQAHQVYEKLGISGKAALMRYWKNQSASMH